MKKSLADKAFSIVDILIMLVVLIVFLWPIWFVIIASFSDPNLVNMGQVLVLPKGFNIDGYMKIFEYKEIWVGYGNSIFYTVVGTALSLSLSICLAYPLSDKSFRPRNAIMVFVMITMYFSGGLIPTYLLLKNLNIVNTRLAMIIPGLISVYNSLIIRSYFMQSIPSELKEAATLDGANSGQYLMKIVLPLSKAVFAVVGLYYAVAYWNNYTKGLYYIYDKDIMPLQNILRDLLMSSKMLVDVVADPEIAEMVYEQSQTMKYGVIIVAALPMMILYPFIQKYFVKGVMVGAVKG